MITPELIELLVCPLTKQRLSILSEERTLRLNQLVAGGGIRSSSGAAVTQPFEAALIRDDGLILYPIREGIPVMLAAEAVPVEGF